MYQFSTTNVINSAYAVDYDGTPYLDSTGTEVPKFTGSATSLNVAKVLDFKKANIVSVYKNPYVAGVKEIATIVVPTPTLGDIMRLTVDIKLSNSTQAEYANYSLDFKKPVTVEIISGGVAIDDATAYVAQLNGLKTRFGFGYFTSANSGTATITITAKETVQHFASIILAKEVANTNSLTQIDAVTVATGTVTTVGKIGFGDNNWMQRSVMLPTYENTRAFGISREERPILGGNYSQYTIRYSLVKDGQDGTVSGSTSVTTHVFFVLASLTGQFETELNKLGLTISTFVIASTDLALATATDDTNQITWTGNIGAVTFATDTPLLTSVSATGLVSTADLTGTGTSIITATDAVGNTDTLSYTVS